MFDLLAVERVFFLDIDFFIEVVEDIPKIAFVRRIAEADGRA